MQRMRLPGPVILTMVVYTLPFIYMSLPFERLKDL